MEACNGLVVTPHAVEQGGKVAVRPAYYFMVVPKDMTSCIQNALIPASA